MSHESTLGNFYYKADTAPANFADYDSPDISFPFKATNVKIAAVADTLQFSLDGKTVHGEILAADGLVEFEGINVEKIWLKGSVDYRVFGWYEE